MAVDLDAIASEFDKNYGRGRLRTCVVCDSEHREVMDFLLARGAGGPSVAKFVRQKYGLIVSQATVQRHKSMHLDDGTAE